MACWPSCLLTEMFWMKMRTTRIPQPLIASRVTSCSVREWRGRESEGQRAGSCFG